MLDVTFINGIALVCMTPDGFRTLRRTREEARYQGKYVAPIVSCHLQELELQAVAAAIPSSKASEHTCTILQEAQ